LSQANAGTTHYAYDAKNKRIWQGSFANSGGDWVLTADTISLFGIDGKLVGTYIPQTQWNNTQNPIAIQFYVNTERVYFRKKLVQTLDGSGGHGVVQDRLESVGKYSPPLANDQVKFASYTRDSVTGLDYADQRYYSSTFGRFMTSDRLDTSADPTKPLSWNRYGYVIGDPVNANDPTGKNDEAVCAGDEGDDSGGDCALPGETGGGGGDGPAGGDGGVFSSANLQTDANGNLILDEGGNPIVGDTNVTNVTNTVTVLSFPLALPSMLAPSVFPSVHPATGPLLVGPPPPKSVLRPSKIECLFDPGFALAFYGPKPGQPNDNSDGGGGTGPIDVNQNANPAPGEEPKLGKDFRKPRLIGSPAAAGRVAGAVLILDWWVAASACNDLRR
jgi:RHS repeat-associated protein